jgi:hypothetical protein
MKSPSNSTCTTVSDRPAELKPITASLCSSFRLASLHHKRGGHRRPSRPPRRRRRACCYSPRLSTRPSRCSCLHAQRRGPCAEFISMYLQCKYSLPIARPTALAAVSPCSERLAAEVRRPPWRPSSASHAVPGNTEETSPGTLRSRSRLSQCRPPPRPRTSTARRSLGLTRLRLGISFTGRVMVAPFVSSMRNVCF